MIFNATTGKSSLNNISIYDKIADANAIGGRYFKIAGTNKVFNLLDILTKSTTDQNSAGDVLSGEEKFKNGQEILESDILPGVLITGHEEYRDNLLSLINNQKLEADKKIRIIKDGKVVELDSVLYNKQEYKGKEGAEEQQYYKTNSGTFLKKEKITPPAFKQMTEDEVRNLVNNDGKSIYDGDFKEFAVVKYVDKENKIHYLRNAKIKYEFNNDTNAYDAVITYNAAMGEDRFEVKTVVVESVSKEVETEQKTEEGLSAKITNVVRYSNDRYKRYDESGKEVEYRFKLDKSPRSITTKFNSNEIHFVEGKSDNPNTIPVKKISKSYRKTGHSRYGSLEIVLEVENENQLVKEDGKIVAIKNLYTGQVFSLDSFPFELKVNGTAKKEQKFDYNKVAVYKESKIFKTENVKSVLEADLIQTSEVGLDSEFTAYDYGERARIFGEFERNIDECKRIAKQGIKSNSDLEKLSNLQKVIDEQLNKIGDYEALKDISEKKKILEAEKAKTGADKDQSKIDDAQKEYDKAVENARLGFYKDKDNLTTIDGLIKDYQEGKFYPTFFFDENGNKIEITRDELTTVTSNLPFDWSQSKSISSILGKDKISFNSNTGRAEVAFNSNAKETMVASAKIASVLLNVCFSAGPLALVAMPFAIPLAAASISVSGIVGLTESVRGKIKEHKINSLTPQKLKNMQDKDLESCMEKEFKKALEKYNEDIAHVDRVFTNEKNREDLLREAEQKFIETRKAVFKQYMLAASGNMTSKFSSKDKKITNENLYGFLEYRRKLKEFKHDKELDLDTEYRMLSDEKKYKDELAKFQVLYANDPELLAAKIEQLEAEKNNAKNKYLSENGSLKNRLSYLRKTNEYYRATKEERKKMEEECKEKCKNAIKKLKIEEVSVSGKSDSELEDLKKRMLALAKTYAPSKRFNGKDFNDEKALLHDDIKVPISVSSEEKHLDQTHDDRELEEVQETVREYTKVSEKCHEALNSNDKKLITSTSDELYDAETETKNKLKNLLGEEMHDKILEDKAMWYDPQKDKSEIRQLQDFVKLLETTYNTEETRKKYLLDKYDSVLIPKVNELIDKLKEEFKNDKDVLEVLKSSKVAMCKKYINKTHKAGTSRYGLMGENEKFIQYLNDINKTINLKTKKDLLIKPYKEIENIMNKEMKKLQEKIFAKYNTLSDEQKDRVDKEFSIIANYGSNSKITKEEFVKAVRKFEVSVKYVAQGKEV